MGNSRRGNGCVQFSASGLCFCSGLVGTTVSKIVQHMSSRESSVSPTAVRSTELTQFKVYARVRPFIEEEKQQFPDGILRSVVEMTGDRTLLLDPRDNFRPKSQFQFDASLWSIPANAGLTLTFADTKDNQYISQHDVYTMTASSSAPDAFEGYNSCIMTYGQTGSGKTYTMMGKYDPQVPLHSDRGEEGIIPRVCHDLFELLDQRRDAELVKPEPERLQIAVEVIFVEIYMEKVRDLLDPALRIKRGESIVMSDAKVRQDSSGPFVEGVKKYQVENWEQCCSLLERGSRQRTTCATEVHQQSSRSHAIFQLTVLQRLVLPPKDRFSRPVEICKAGRINLVDLAGSERGGMTDYVKESAQINKSLLALRRVIDNLVERQNALLEQARCDVANEPISERALPQVPFRDSVLTWLLSDSIGGNARTAMIAALSPSPKNYGDTLATLQWSSKARNLITVVRANDTVVSVAEGVSSQLNSMHGTLQQQQRNLDTIRNDLAAKQREQVELDMDSRALMVSTIRSKEKQGESLKQAAALPIQRVLKHSLLRRRKAMNADQLQERRKTLEKVTCSRQEAEQDLAASREVLGGLSSRIAQLCEEVEDHHDLDAEMLKKEEELRRRKEALKDEYTKIMEEAQQQLCTARSQLEALEHETANARMATAKAASQKEEVSRLISTLDTAEIARCQRAAKDDDDRLSKILHELESAAAAVEQQTRRKEELVARKRDLLSVP